jgi:quercetin dioxygenase-like cupin family protein
MSLRISAAAARRWADCAAIPGLREAVLVGADTGATHLEVRLCELRAGAAIPAHRHPFEESWYILSGSGRRSVAGLRYDVAAGDYGLSPVAAAHALDAADDGLSWLSVRAPQPPRFPGAASSIPAGPGTGEDLGRPSETDPAHRHAGHFELSDLAPYAQLSMPGYHGPRVTGISVRMLVDRLLGAQHHTMFIAQIAPQPGQAHPPGEHYHPFEEIYFFLSGAVRGRLDGQDVHLAAGDLAWLGVGATHGFDNEGDQPARWLEVQSPVPPDSDAFFFPDDWRALRG